MAKEEVTENEEVKVETTEAPEVEAAEATTETTEEVKIAKAGKRSEKALKEAEEKQAKEERKAQTAEEEAEEKPKQHANPTRSRLERQGKNFRKAAEQIEKDKNYSLSEGLELATKTSPVKFDASVELHVNLNVDPRHADQNLRDNLVLPAGTGKTIRVAVMDDTKVEGADISGVETILGALEKGEINFDILISTPAQMPKLGKYARVLGPRGLMPNPKSGTVTNDIAKAVNEAKAGRVEYRVDSTGIVHVAIGKVSFGAKKLEENARAVLTNLKGNKPNSVKGTYVKAIHLATTMGPSITIDNSEL
ncbi:MAG TPA: 50S ribosomal protein L1 [Candidatus Saccharimonadales bacterium]|nr:50S ribosomal protein L1 [Candidatus Saccharimonadales bacterium]